MIKKGSNLLNLIFVFMLLIACEQNQKKEKISKPNEVLQEPKTEIIKKENKTQPKTSDYEAAKPINNQEIEHSLDCTYEQNMASQGLVNIKDIDPSILVNLKYSTNDNFVGRDVYGCLTDCYLQKKAAEMLAKASVFLQSENDSLRLLVYDGARPHAIQEVLWASLPQYTPAKRKTFVADPAIGSIHNYGSAVDLTIANVNGNPLDMGTKYDYFGELAYPKLEKHFLETGELSQNQVNNRILLRKVMQKAGFMPIEYEWWHFNAVSRSKAKALYSIVK